MKAFESELCGRLAALRKQGLYRELRRIDSPQMAQVISGGRLLVNFSSNDYLGLANEPLLKEAAIEAIKKHGAGAGASRLISGSLAPHHLLEEQLAAFKGVEAALTFATGYAAALGTIGALMGQQDVVILDKLSHACLIDATRLSGATLRVFAHNDLNQLEDRLKWACDRNKNVRIDGTPRPRALVVTESVFSMDGDQPPLKEIVELKERYGAWLMVDEAHATGVYGANRCGVLEELGLSDQVEIQMGTLGKAVGASGGYICGSRALIEFLVNRARSFIFSTAPVPASAAAAAAGVRFIQSGAGEDRRRTLWQRIAQLEASLSIAPGTKLGAVVPLIVGNENKAMRTAEELREQGIFIPAIRYPTVARGSARLRVSLTASHSAGELERLVAALRSLELIPAASGVQSHASVG
jgi:8-amino-7-oxononanoate synthase